MCRYTMIGRIAVACAALLCAAQLCGCGYRLARMDNPALAPYASIAIPYFQNKSFEPQAEAIFTHAFADEFVESRRLVLAPEHQADLVLHGSVQDLHDRVIAYSADDKALEYRVIVTMSITLQDRRSGAVVWKRDKLQHAEEYPVGTDIAFSEAAKRDALRRLAADLAERVHDNVMQGF
jgi:outer membrane lipopolysaccharide assembly protein LptE/RlpB